MTEAVPRVSRIESPRIDRRVVEYPSSDGKPVAETPLHYDRLRDLATALQLRYEGRDDVYVGANMLVYYEEGNKDRHLAPDLLVVFGVGDHRRDVFLLWEEKAPAFILEITSKSTRGRDEHEKRERYAEWGVGEYFLYDPRAEYLVPPLRGLALAGDGYRDMTERVLANGARGLRSRTLGLDLWLRDGELRLHDPVAGTDLLTPREHAARGDAEAARADVEAVRADAAVAKARSEAARADSLAEALARAEARLRQLDARPREPGGS